MFQKEEVERVRWEQIPANPNRKGEAQRCHRERRGEQIRTPTRSHRQRGRPPPSPVFIGATEGRILRLSPRKLVNRGEEGPLPSRLKGGKVCPFLQL